MGEVGEHTGFQGSETTLHNTEMKDPCRYTFVQTHRRYRPGEKSDVGKEKAGGNSQLYEYGFATCWAKEPYLQSGITQSSTFQEQYNACYPCNFKFPNSHILKTETGEINDLFNTIYPKYYYFNKYSYKSY